MSAETCFSEILASPESWPWNHQVYADNTADWTLTTPCLVLKQDAEELDDDPDALPRQVIDLGFDHVLGIQDFQMIVSNAILQNSQATPDDLMDAFLHYYDNDAYIDFAETDHRPNSSKSE